MSMTYQQQFVLDGLAGRAAILDLTARYNSSADISPTASQMPRLVGLAQASVLYREIEGLDEVERFSRHGNEVAFGEYALQIVSCFGVFLPELLKERLRPSLLSSMRGLCCV